MNKRDWFERHAKAAPPDPNKDYDAVLEQAVDQRGKAMTLVERLRESAVFLDSEGYLIAATIGQAADRIEVLEKVLREITVAPCTDCSDIARKALGEE